MQILHAQVHYSALTPQEGFRWASNYVQKQRCHVISRFFIFLSRKKIVLFYVTRFSTKILALCTQACQNATRSGALLSPSAPTRLYSSQGLASSYVQNQRDIFLSQDFSSTFYEKKCTILCEQHMSTQ